MYRCILWIAVLIFFFQFSVSAQEGIAEMNQVKNDLKRSFFGALDASLMLAAILGICGALRIYHNWQLGKHHFHVDYEVVAWFSASLFMVLMGAFLQKLYGL
ncbi:DUF4134 family protein [Pedobacter sp. MC2016-24]|uniref:DUF4134 family protein n=1 Tax=Pedobacter sp. MC2016-24 TaxID=2780090 RepID=UPI001880E4A6|nr:DUF4134 family protein [Pedobacter sp. MC2016-24]MBE9599892.1 DUF4134 family protein [Pedobacter sp. MC2016-24]